MSHLTEKLITLLSEFPHKHKEKVEVLLKLGKEVIGADYALLSYVKGYHYRINIKLEKKPIFDSFYTLDQTFCKSTIENGETLIVEDVIAHNLADVFFSKKLGLKAFISIPIASEDAIIGTVSYHSEGKLVIDNERLNFLKLLCYHIQDSVGFDEMREKFDKYYSLLEEKNQDLSKFSYMVAHDLKAPLRAINSLIDFMSEDLEDKEFEALPGHLRMIKEKSIHMVHLIRDILEYSKVGTEEVVSENLALKYFINDICFEVSVSGTNIEVYNKVDDLSILNKKVFLYQTISNIVNNAVKYSDKKKCIVEISSKEQGDFVEISIDDNGPGIPEKHRERIFDVFQVAHDRNDVESTGIGLSIVKRLVDRMGGKIRCEEGEKGGARFVFTLNKNVD